MRLIYPVLTVLLFSLWGCRGPSDKEMFTEAGKLLASANNLELTNVDKAGELYGKALTLLEEIPSRYPGGDLAVEMIKGSLVINGVQVLEVRKRAQTVRELASASTSVFSAALFRARHKGSPETRASALIAIGNVLLKTNSSVRIIDLLREALSEIETIKEIKAQRDRFLSLATLAMQSQQMEIALAATDRASQLFSRSTYQQFESPLDICTVLTLRIGLGQIDRGLEFVKNVVDLSKTSLEVYRAFGQDPPLQKLHQDEVDSVLGSLIITLKDNEVAEKACLDNNRCLLAILDTFAEAEARAHFLDSPFFLIKEKSVAQKYLAFLEPTLPVAASVASSSGNTIPLISLAKRACGLGKMELGTAAAKEAGRQITATDRLFRRNPEYTEKFGTTIYETAAAFDACGLRGEARRVIEYYRRWIEANYLKFQNGTKEDFPCLLIQVGLDGFGFDLVKKIPDEAFKFATASSGASCAAQQSNLQATGKLVRIADDSLTFWNKSSNQPGIFAEARLQSYVLALLFLGETEKAKRVLKENAAIIEQGGSFGEIVLFLRKYVPRLDPYNFLVETTSSGFWVPEITRACEKFADEGDTIELGRCLDWLRDRASAEVDREQHDGLLLLTWRLADEVGDTGRANEGLKLLQRKEPGVNLLILASALKSSRPKLEKEFVEEMLWELANAPDKNDLDLNLSMLAALEIRDRLSISARGRQALLALLRVQSE